MQSLRIQQRMLRSCLLAYACVLVHQVVGSAQQAVNPPPAAPTVVRELFVPYDDLQVVLESAPQRVFLQRVDYERLLKAARRTPLDKAPRQASLIGAEYQVHAGDGRATITGTFLIDVLETGLHTVPLAWTGVGVRSALLDGQPAPLALQPDGTTLLFVEGKGRKRLEVQMVAPIETTAALQSLAVNLPATAATRWRMVVAGNVEIKNGAAVSQREFDANANVTRFELLPNKAGEKLVMTLNNRQLLRDRVVMARSVLVDEVTQGYERLHATITYSVLHGATDRFRLRVPAGFDVTEVSTPLLARWGFESSAKEAGGKEADGKEAGTKAAAAPQVDAVLEIQLREPATSAAPVTIQVVASRSGRPAEAWRFPGLEALDTAGHVAVLGLLAEERWNVDALVTTGLVPIDATMLTKALPSSVQSVDTTAPPVRTLAAYYAPQPGHTWSARFQQPPPKLRATGNVLLVVGQKLWEVRGGFSLTPEVDRVFGVDLRVPNGWVLTQVTTASGENLPIEMFATEDGMQQRAHVRIPKGIAPNVAAPIFFRAEATPAGWLDTWPERRFALEFPLFLVQGADQVEGAIAVRAGEDLRLVPGDAAKFQGLTPLDENEKNQYGLAGTATDFAYRHDSPSYSAAFVAEPVEPELTARAYSFLKLDADALTAHYEIAFQIDRGRTQELTFQLPSTTPPTLAIRGLDGVVVKEFGASDDAANDGWRNWRVVLANRVTGRVRLAVDFQQNLPSSEPKGMALPLVRAVRSTVNYQSGLLAVESAGELDVQLQVDAAGPGNPRKVDVGELAEADYLVGRRVLGAYGYLGETPVATIDVERRDALELATAIAQRVELVTLMGPNRRAVTAARFLLRSKASYLEVRMPAGATLWSAQLDQQAVAPQRSGDRLLLSLPATSEETLRDVQFVYESIVAPLNMMRGRLEATAPRLYLGDELSATPREVPLADVEWKVLLPGGYRLALTEGTVFPDWNDEETRQQLALRPAPWVTLAENLDHARHWSSVQMRPAETALARAWSFRHTFSLSSDRADAAKSVASAVWDQEDALDGLAMPQDQSNFAPQASVATAPNARNGFPLAGGGAMAPGGGAMGGMGGMPGMPGGTGMPGGMGGGGRGGALPEGITARNYAGRSSSDRAPSSASGAISGPMVPAAPGAIAAPPPPPMKSETSGPSDARAASQKETPKAAELAEEYRARAKQNLDGAAEAKTDAAAGQNKAQGQVAEGEGFNDLWALQGVRSLPFDFSPYINGPGQRLVTFRSLGDEPQLDITIVAHTRWLALAWGVAILFAVRGLFDTAGTVVRKTRRVFGGLLLASVLPVITPWHQEMATLADPLFTVSALLGVWYLGVGFVRIVGGRLTRRHAQVAATVLALFCLTAATCFAQPAAADDDAKRLPTVAVPADAIIIPYNPAAPDSWKDSPKVFVPYDKYVELWNQANPDHRLQIKPPPAPYAWGGVTYEAVLDQSNDLLVRGRLSLELFTSDIIDVPLPLAGGVLVAAQIDGRPAQLRIVVPQAVAAPPQQPPPPQANQLPAQAAQVAQAAQNPAQRFAPPAESSLLALTTSGHGRKQVELQFRLKLERRGGWRIAEGRLPSGPTAAFNLVVASTGTEVRLGDVADRGRYETEKDGQRIETALAPSGQINLQWRPKVAAGEVDRGLAVDSNAEIDVREDALRVVWQLVLQFPRARRDNFTLLVPQDYLVERVVGDNVRGWVTTAVGEQQKVELTLLKTAVDQERVMLVLSRRGTIGQGNLERLPLPAVVVADAVLHQGSIALRRSPALNVHMDELRGLSPAERPGESLSQTVNLVEESPLGVRPLQALRFKTPGFAGTIVAKTIPAIATASLKSLLKVEERRAQFESRIDVVSADRPLHQLRVRLPVGIKLTDVVVPGAVQWVLSSDEGRPLLTVLLQNGAIGMTSLVVRGSMERTAGQDVALPQVEMLDVTRQEGTLVIQVDPAVDVRAENLQGCESVLLSRTFGWLVEAQRGSARLALAHRNENYSGTLKLTRREPRVSCFTVTNIRLTSRSLEETAMLEFRIEEAGIREVSFLLPASLRSARISAPLLRRKLITDVLEETSPTGMVRVKLELQDEVMGQFRVLVENDRLITSDVVRAPIPTVETGRTDQRFVTLESSGRDEVVFEQQEGVEPITRQQQAWARLAGLFGENILAAFQVKADVKQPVLSLRTKSRATIETAQARIALAQTDLEVDENGTYRARQTYQVDNGTEQYLVVELPEGGELWTVEVAGERVRPQPLPGAANARQIRVPLVKTAQGDLDYPVVLTYGGKLGKPGLLSRVRFPFLKTINIHVELSRVRLLLPSNQKWFDFSGSLGRVDDRGEYEASGLEYQIKRISRLSDLMNGSAADELTKVRVTSNLKQLGMVIQNPATPNYANDDFVRNSTMLNSLLEQTKKQVADQEQSQTAAETKAVSDNRDRLQIEFNQQSTQRAVNVVTELGGNFFAQPQVASGGAEAPAFNERWFAQNGLDQKKATSRVIIDDSAKNSAKPTGQANGGRKGGNVVPSQQQSLEALRNGAPDKSGAKAPAEELPAFGVNPNGDGSRARVAREQTDLNRRYQRQLEAQQGDKLQEFAQNPVNGPTSGNGQVSPRGPVPAYQSIAPPPPTRGNVQDESGAKTKFYRAEQDFAERAPSDPFGERNDNFGLGGNTAGGQALATGYLTGVRVELPGRGTEFLFRTPRGDLELTARSAPAPMVDRVWRLLGVLGLAIPVWVLLRFAKR